MYEIHDVKMLSYPHVVRMSFELPYLDWCRFEKSKLFQNLISYLEELQRQNIPIQKKEGGDRNELSKLRRFRYF